MQQFRQGVKERMSGVNGCSHLTELALVLPTAAIRLLPAMLLTLAMAPVAQPNLNNRFSLTVATLCVWMVRLSFSITRVGRNLCLTQNHPASLFFNYLYLSV
jgi:hypothetical protein